MSRQPTALPHGLVVNGDASHSIARRCVSILEKSGRDVGFFIDSSLQLPRAVQGAERRLPLLSPDSSRPHPMASVFVTDANPRDVPASFAVTTCVVSTPSSSEASSHDREWLREVIERVDRDGVILVGVCDADAIAIANAHAKARLSYVALSAEDAGTLPPHWLAAPIEAGAGRTVFDLFAGGVFAGRHLAKCSGDDDLRSVLFAIAATCEGFGVALSSALPLAR